MQWINTLAISKAEATASAVRSSSSSPLYKAANAVRLSPSSSGSSAAGAVIPSFSTPEASEAREQERLIYWKKTLI